MRNDLQDILSGQPVQDHGLLDVGLVFRSNDELWIPPINAASDGYSSAVPASGDIRAASSSRFRNSSETPSKHLRYHRRAFTMRNPSDASSVNSDKVPVTDLERYCKYLFLVLRKCWLSFSLLYLFLFYFIDTS